jgi:nicotinate-nucleotide adenylyltransferase
MATVSEAHGLRLDPGSRVGLFGGSFNPAHEGHLHVAEAALERLRLDRLVWLVSPQNPLKAGEETMTLRARMDGVRRLARDPRMVVSDFESRAGSPYTIDTIRTLQAAFPDVDFVWVMGSDNLKGFHRWRDWRAITRSLPIAVVARPGSALAGRHSIFGRRLAGHEIDERHAARLPDVSAPAWCLIHAGWNHASSTALRSRLRAAAD